MQDKGLKTVHVPRGYKGLHVEADGVIVNIRVGLHNNKGQQVTHISVMADGARFMGDAQWWAEWGEVDDLGGVCRIIQRTKIEPSLPNMKGEK
jgi:hypothetical protein